MSPNIRYIKTRCFHNTNHSWRHDLICRKCGKYGPDDVREKEEIRRQITKEQHIKNKVSSFPIVVKENIIKPKRLYRLQYDVGYGRSSFKNRFLTPKQYGRVLCTMNNSKWGLVKSIQEIKQ